MDFVKGQAVSFVIGEGPKGAAAKEVQAEEGGIAEEVAPEEEEEEGERQLGKVKVHQAVHESDDDLFETLLIVYSPTMRRKASLSLHPAAEAKSERHTSCPKRTSHADMTLQFVQPQEGIRWYRAIRWITCLLRR